MADRHGHPVPDGGPSYCSNCGEAVEPDDSYCSDCGHQLDGAADATDSSADASDDPSEQSLEEFRRRVSDYELVATVRAVAVVRLDRFAAVRAVRRPAVGDRMIAAICHRFTHRHPLPKLPWNCFSRNDS